MLLVAIVGRVEITNSNEQNTEIEEKELKNSKSKAISKLQLSSSKLDEGKKIALKH